MRLALISHAAWLGGAERSLAELAAALRDDAEVHAVLPAEGPLRARLEAAGARVSVVPGRWWARDPAEGRPRPDWRGARAMTRALAALAPDAVLSSTMVHPPGALAAARLRLPHLWWVQEFGRRDHGFRFLLGLGGTRRAIRALSRVVLAPSAAVAAELGRGVRRMPYWIDVPAQAPAARDGRRLVLCGRIRPSKGQQDAVRALAHLPDAELDLVGDGNAADVAVLERLAERLGVRERVRLHGGLADPLPVLDRAGIALMCSRDEAFGRVTVEAMKRGLPVVGAAAGGTVEILDGGRAGRLYPPGDARALAEAIRAVRADSMPVARAGYARATATWTREGLRAGALAAFGEALG